MSLERPKTSPSSDEGTPCRWAACDKTATGPDGYCDRHAVEYWRVWRDHLPDVWVDAVCSRCKARHRVALKQCEVRGKTAGTISALCPRCRTGGTR